MKKLFFVLALIGACFCMQSCFCAHDYYAPYGHHRYVPARHYRPAPPPRVVHRGYYY